MQEHRYEKSDFGKANLNVSQTGEAIVFMHPIHSDLGWEQPGLAICRPSMEWKPIQAIVCTDKKFIAFAEKLPHICLN